MSLFMPGLSLETLNGLSKDTMVAHLGIEFTEITEDSIAARMPVDARTHQPFKLLHGGASVSLAETLGSVAAQFTLDQEKQYAVGLEINANHVRGIRSGWVVGKAKPLHHGRTTQVWEIRIESEDEGKLICISRITMAILDR